MLIEIFVFTATTSIIWYFAHFFDMKKRSQAKIYLAIVAFVVLQCIVTLSQF